MSVFSRLSDIVNSNLNSILDRAEDPQKMVRLVILEMEEVLVEVRSSAAKAIADIKEAQRHKESFIAEAAEWEEKAAIAVKANRDDLAQRALAEKIDAEKDVAALDSELALLNETLEKFGEDIESLEQKIHDAKQRQTQLEIRGESAKVRLGVRRQLSRHNVDNVLQRFEAHERRLDDLDGQVESYSLGGGKTLSEEIAELEGDEKVGEELAELKKRIEQENG